MVGGLRGSLSAVQGMPSFGAAGGSGGGGGQGGGQLAFLRQNQQFQVRCTAWSPSFSTHILWLPAPLLSVRGLSAACLPCRAS